MKKWLIFAMLSIFTIVSFQNCGKGFKTIDSDVSEYDITQEFKSSLRGSSLYLAGTDNAQAVTSYMNPNVQAANYPVPFDIRGPAFLEKDYLRIGNPPDGYTFSLTTAEVDFMKSKIGSSVNDVKLGFACENTYKVHVIRSSGGQQIGNKTVIGCHLLSAQVFSSAETSISPPATVPPAAPPNPPPPIENVTTTTTKYFAPTTTVKYVSPATIPTTTTTTTTIATTTSTTTTTMFVPPSTFPPQTRAPIPATCLSNQCLPQVSGVKIYTSDGSMPRVISSGEIAKIYGGAINVGVYHGGVAEINPNGNGDIHVYFEKNIDTYSLATSGNQFLITDACGRQSRISQQGNSHKTTLHFGLNSFVIKEIGANGWILGVGPNSTTNFMFNSGDNQALKSFAQSGNLNSSEIYPSFVSCY